MLPIANVDMPVQSADQMLLVVSCNVHCKTIDNRSSEE
jgi:hypothetical protein